MKKVFGNKLIAAAATSSNSFSTAKLCAAEPETISGFFKDDYNIQAVHNKVLRHFADQDALTATKQRERERATWIRDNSSSLAERKRATYELNLLDQWLVQATAKTHESNYLARALPLLAEYATSLAGKRGRTFGVKKVADATSEQRELLILKYLAVAGEYIAVNVVLDSHSEPQCVACRTPLPEGSSDCPNCPAFVVDFETDNSYKDNERATIPSRNSYGKSDHIHDAFIKYQGKQTNKLPPEMVDDLTTTIKAYGMDVRSLSIDTLYEILRNKKYSSYYDEIYLLYHIITHKPLPLLDDIQNELFRDADLFTSVYHEIKPKGRHNCLNAHFIRDVLLRRYNRADPTWQCTSLRTSEVSAIHNETMKRAYERLGWGEYSPL